MTRYNEPTMEPHALTEGTYFIRFAVALLLGVAIGLEREWRQRMAGLHTTAMVSAGAAMFAMIAPLLEAKGADPTRIAAQVVSGIGFLAGGVILRQGANVRGLTTAATLWATSAVGVLVGFGFIVQATGAAIVIISANITLYPLARYVNSFKRSTADVMTKYTIEIASTVGSEARVREQIVDSVSSTDLSMLRINSSPIDSANVLVRAELACTGRDDRQIERLAAAMKAIDGVAAAQWQAAEEYT